jgi:predicted NAD-dependent protein-ADP-ribosyltransferase YbiA (DUF1768 family)
MQYTFESRHGHVLEPARACVFFFSGGKIPPDDPTTDEDYLATFPTMGSNFGTSPITLADDRRFSSAEALFQATRMPSEVDSFTTSGLYGTASTEAFEALGFRTNDARAKAARAARRRIDGVTAKLRINKLRKMKMTREHTAEECARIFWEIQLLKYRQNPRARKALEATGDAELLEFVRSTTRRLEKDPRDVERWGGMLVSSPRRIVGHNQMGALLMAIREYLRCDNLRSAEARRVPTFDELLHGTSHTARES